jgi:signal transduction histidine kinase
LGGDLLLDAFENIILNAIIHNKSKNKKVWIDVSDFERDKILYIRIEFKDNGIGIADESKQIIFTKSYKKEKATVGMGIGLSLVNEIISEYGGEIWAENRVENDYTQGTNLILLLKKA